MADTPQEKGGVVKPIIVLATIAIISAGLLAGVNAMTLEPIAASQKQEKVNAFKSLPPGDMTNDPFGADETTDKVAATWKDPVDGTDQSGIVYVKRKDGAVVGYMVECQTTKGYSGLIKLLVGIDGAGALTGYHILEMAETPGLGTNAIEPYFKDQFTGKSLESFNFKVKKDGGDVEAITSATITSRAVSGALENAIHAVKSLSEGGAK